MWKNQVVIFSGGIKTETNLREISQESQSVNFFPRAFIGI